MGKSKINSDVCNAIKTIIQHGAEADAICILAKRMNQNMNQAKSKELEARASLRAIRKINNGENKSIDALCE